jgi:hypothetical protein
MGETISVDINADPVTDPMDEQIQKLQKGEETTPTPDAEGEPSLLAGKFDSQEALEKAYLELQSKLGSQSAEEPPEAGGEEPAFSLKPEGGEAAATPGFDAEKYQQEFMAEGKLSDDSVKELQKLGIPQEMIDTHTAGLQAIKDARQSAILGMFGGNERMESVLAWARNNLSEGEAEAITTQANSTDMGTCETAIRGLVARFDSSPMGQTAPLEGATGGSSIQPFKSTAEMVKAMSDERYKTDPAYRDEVAARVQA